MKLPNNNNCQSPQQVDQFPTCSSLPSHQQKQTQKHHGSGDGEEQINNEITLSLITSSTSPPRSERRPASNDDIFQHHQIKKEELDIDREPGGGMMQRLDFDSKSFDGTNNIVEDVIVDNRVRPDEEEKEVEEEGEEENANDDDFDGIQYSLEDYRRALSYDGANVAPGLASLDDIRGNDVSGGNDNSNNDCSNSNDNNSNDYKDVSNKSIDYTATIKTITTSRGKQQYQQQQHSSHVFDTTTLVTPITTDGDKNSNRCKNKDNKISNQNQKGVAAKLKLRSTTRSFLRLSRLPSSLTKSSSSMPMPQHLSSPTTHSSSFSSPVASSTVSKASCIPLVNTKNNAVSPSDKIITDNNGCKSVTPRKKTYGEFTKKQSSLPLANTPSEATVAKSSTTSPATVASPSNPNCMPIVFSQQRMIYPNEFFLVRPPTSMVSTPVCPSSLENVDDKNDNEASFSISAYLDYTASGATGELNTLAEPTNSSSNQSAQSQHQSQSSHDSIQITAPSWRAYFGVTEFGFDCYATPKYIAPAGSHGRKKYDGAGCIGWGGKGNVIRGGTASAATAKPELQSSSSSMPSPLPSSTLLVGAATTGNGISSSLLSSPSSATSSTSTTSSEKGDEGGQCEGAKAKVSMQPLGHIYALREVCYAETSDGEEKEEERATFNGVDNESPPSIIEENRPPRIITSRVVCTTENVHLHLEESSAGTALCPAWKRDNSCESIINGHIFHRVRSELDPFFYSTGLIPSEDVVRSNVSEKRPPGRLILVTVPLSEIKSEIGDDNELGSYSDSTSVEVVPTSVCAEVDRAFRIHEDYLADKKSRDRAGQKKKWKYPRKILNSMKQFKRRSRHDGEKRNLNNSQLAYHGSIQDCVALCSSSHAKVQGTNSFTDILYAQSANGNQIPRTLHFANPGAKFFNDDAVLSNNIDPIEEIVCISQSLGIYVCESGLTTPECHQIIGVSEACATAVQGWSSYTYAKQTLGCREHDPLAFVSRKPVMRACATIRKHLVYNDESEDKETIGYDVNDNASNGDAVFPQESARPQKKKDMVLDAREPHVVKYDLSRKERQKLDMHTDKSIWTFLIALSEGRGFDYGEGGTFFEALNSTVHLQRGQMLIFRGKLRHKGVKISFGSRYLLVGFLVEQKNGGKPALSSTNNA